MQGQIALKVYDHHSDTNQIKSNQIKSNQIKSNQIKSNQIKSNQIKFKIACYKQYFDHL